MALQVFLLPLYLMMQITGIPANDFTRGQAFYDLVIEADPANDNILYVGGIDLFRVY